MGNRAPLYRPLPMADVRKIDRTARRILREVGICIDSPHWLDRLNATGARVDYSKRRVRFGGAWLDRMVAQAPTRFTLYSRDGKNDVPLGSGEVHFVNGGRVFRILNMKKGRYRATRLKDIANTATLVHHLENIRVYVVACQAHDVDPARYHLVDFYHAFNHTTKHVMGGCDNLAGAEQMWSLARLIAGSAEAFRAKPFVSVITNPMSPLTLDANTLHIIRFCAERGIPLTCATAPIAGATAPMTLAGTLAQMHAEALAGVAIAQALAPGAPVLYGAFPTVMDMKTMGVTTGCVEMGMMNASAVPLAKLYQLPIYASGGVTEAKRPDIQAGFEKNFSNMTVAMAGADFIHLTAGLMDSANSISYEQFVIDDENIAMIQRIRKGVQVDAERLAFDVIKAVGPGGHFLMQEHTVRHLDELYYPALSERCSFEVWNESGRPSMLKRAHVMVGRILQRRHEAQLDPATIQAVERRFPGVASARIRPVVSAKSE